MRQPADWLFPGTAGGRQPVKSIRISIPDQTLELDEDGIAIRRYLVSTSKNGAGEKYGSFCTPRGRHIVRAKVGAGAPVNTVFVKRRPTGEIYSPELGSRFPGRDWMLTRLLWLSGCEPGFNRLGDVDTSVFEKGAKFGRRFERTVRAQQLLRRYVLRARNMAGTQPRAWLGLDPASLRVLR